MNRFVHIAVAACLVSGAFAQELVETTTTLKVRDEANQPISGARVSIVYSPFSTTGNYVRGSGLTDDDGSYAFTGLAFYQIFVSVEKSGYYASRAEDRAYEYDETNRRKVWRSPEINLQLKRIIDPVPMFAQQRLMIVVPKFNVPLEFDFFARDWLPPFGNGKFVDVVIEVNGVYHSWTDRDTTLSIVFPNEGDGLIPFEGEIGDGSELLSPQFAPLGGYSSEYRHRKAALPTEERDLGGDPVVEYIGTDVNPINYIFRIRTRFDENGEVKSAHYGKLYNAFEFDGVWDRESVVSFGDYYLNPDNDSRSLEYEVGKNLIEELKSFDKPSRP